MNYKKMLNIFFFLLCFIPAFAFAGMANLSDRPVVQDFIKNMAIRYNFNGPYLTYLFSQTKIQPGILKIMQQPKEYNPWYRYQAFFITDKRINDGVTFWNEHAKALALAQKQYGVPPNIIVAIIGVETHYGHYMGNYRVIDSLSTLAFNYPPRQKFFKQELAQFLLLTREQQFNPLRVTGSYAGAIGVPQFMPSSYRQYAVSITNGNKSDLSNNADDAIMSVANYFKNHGWQAEQPVVIPAVVDHTNPYFAGNKTLQPKFTLQQLAATGVRPQKNISPNTIKANLLALQDSNNNEYWLGFNNFYVIMQYNPRINYAMAVYQLGQAIQDKRMKRAA